MIISYCCIAVVLCWEESETSFSSWWYSCCSYTIIPKQTTSFIIHFESDVVIGCVNVHVKYVPSAIGVSVIVCCVIVYVVVITNSFKLVTLSTVITCLHHEHASVTVFVSKCYCVEEPELCFYVLVLSVYLFPYHSSVFSSINYVFTISYHYSSTCCCTISCSYYAWVALVYCSYCSE